MTQVDKDLLLKDLCARLPYGVKISKVIEDFVSEPRPIRSINLNNIIVEDGEFEDGTPDIDVWNYEDIRPYLFPLSSMTEELKEELKHEISKQTDILIERMKNDDCGIDCGKYHFHSILELEWLLKNHFDYRGLIEKGLAIDATEKGVY